MEERRLESRVGSFPYSSLGGDSGGDVIGSVGGVLFVRGEKQAKSV
jgi:hypothetical protein